MDGLRKRAMAVCFEAEVEPAACSRAGDEAMVCSRARIEDGRWRWWHDSF
jgi:hypothetical protein